jgi:hypothetical protein
MIKDWIHSHQLQSLVYSITSVDSSWSGDVSGVCICCRWLTVVHFFIIIATCNCLNSGVNNIIDLAVNDHMEIVDIIGILFDLVPLKGCFLTTDVTHILFDVANVKSGE